jgi:hypothetical protein
MTTQSEPNEPNEFGFAGGATTPEPKRPEPTEDVDGESIAVPAGDLTGAITGAIEGLSDDDEESR